MDDEIEGGACTNVQPRSEKWSEASVIHAFSREQAIGYGELIDLADFGDLVKEAGLAHPTAMTTRAFGRSVRVHERERSEGCDEKGRLWDVLVVAAAAMRAAGAGGHDVRFKVEVVRSWALHEVVRLKVVCHPGDDGEPVLTIMLDDED